jgi:hypothetical protein
VKLRGSLVGPVAAFLCVHCLPDLDKLSSKYGESPPSEHSGGAGGSSGSGQGEGGALTGGQMNGGRGGSGGKGGSSTGAKGGKGGSSTGAKGGTGTGATGGSGGTQAGQGGEAGEAGVGQSGAPQGGTSGMMSGGSSNAGSSNAGSSNAAGAGGAGPDLPCTDGCVLLYVPPSANFQQFFTINLDLANGYDLSDSVFTAHLRAIDFTGTSESIQFYASATNYAFWGNGGVSAPLSTLTDGGTLTMDLTNTPGWDSTHTISFGFLLRGAQTTTTVQVLVEDISVAVKADPQATPKVGPWLFTQESDVNEATAETIDVMYGVNNVIFANPYNAVTGAKAKWEPPGP